MNILSQEMIPIYLEDGADRLRNVTDYSKIIAKKRFKDASVVRIHNQKGVFLINCMQSLEFFDHFLF